MSFNERQPSDFSQHRSPSRAAATPNNQEPKTTHAMQQSRSNAESLAPKQLRRGRAVNAPMQLRINSDPDSLNWRTTGKFDPIDYSELPNPHVKMRQMSDTTLPQKIPGMDDQQTSQVVADPSRGDRQRLTRMHMVRGKFGGPGSVDNLRLGTASSNNGGAGSHTKEVEYPIEQFIKGSSGQDNERGVSYSVSVGNAAVPAYLRQRAGNDNNVKAFLNKWCPTTFDCKAVFYSYWYDQSGDMQWWKSDMQQESVRLDIGS